MTEENITENKKDNPNALQNYNDWILKRHDVQSKLSKRLSRRPGELLMNSTEEYREVVEEKEAIFYTSVPQKFDKYRGNPAWFELPPYLKEPCQSEAVKYFSQKTNIQKNKIPLIERVGIADCIKLEKMVLPRRRNLYTSWKNSNYRNKRFCDNENLLKNIIPHKPDFGNLAIVGNDKLDETTLGDSEENIPNSECLYSEFYSEGKRKNTILFDISLQTCLRINDIYLYHESPATTTTRKILIFFDYDVNECKLETKYVTFENVGRTTIRIHWHKYLNTPLFADIPKVQNTGFFCFNKNEIILVPGQIMTLPFWFKTDKICSIIETWEIRTIPKLWSEPVKFLFKIQAQTHMTSCFSKILSIKEHISARVKKRIMQEVLEDLLSKTKFETNKIITFEYNEGDLFEACNVNDDLERRPKYLYNKNVVDSLKEFYQVVKLPCHRKTWNFSISDLKILARLKDIIEYAEDKTKKFTANTNKNTSSEYQSLKDSKVGKNLKLKNPESKNALIKSNIQNKSEIILKETNYTKLMKMVWKLSPPNFTTNINRLKYFYAYTILGSYISLLTEELNKLTKNSQKFSSGFLSSINNAERLIFEYPNDFDLKRTKHNVQDNKFKSHPKGNIFDHFNDSNLPKINLGKEEAGNDKKVKDKKSDKKSSTNHTVRSKMVDSSVNINYFNDVKLNFNPYADDELLSLVSHKEIAKYSSQDQKFKTPSLISTMDSFLIDTSTLNENEHHMMYVMVYDYLGQAIDSMVDMLESCKEYKISHKNLEHVKDCYDLFPNNNETINNLSDQINPFSSDDEKKYFETILLNHLNETTTKFFILGEFKSESKNSPSSSLSSILQANHKNLRNEENLVSTKSNSSFSTPVIEPDVFLLKDNEVQTSLTYVPDENVKDTGDADCLCPSEFYEDLKKDSLENFYYSDDEDLPKRSYINIIYPHNSGASLKSKQSFSKSRSTSFHQTESKLLGRYKNLGPKRTSSGKNDSDVSKTKMSTNSIQISKKSQTSDKKSYMGSINVNSHENKESMSSVVNWHKKSNLQQIESTNSLENKK